MFITSVCRSTDVCLHVTTEKPLNKVTLNLALVSLTKNSLNITIWLKIKQQCQKKKQLKHYNLVKNQTTMPENLTGQDICTDTWKHNIKRGIL